MAAYLKEFSYVYCYYEIDDYDKNDFLEFLTWCEAEHIYTIKDLRQRIVSKEQHQKLWIDRCQNYFKSK